jgi:hypothetical protein
MGELAGFDNIIICTLRAAVRHPAPAGCGAAARGVLAGRVGRGAGAQGRKKVAPQAGARGAAKMSGAHLSWGTIWILEMHGDGEAQTIVSTDEVRCNRHKTKDSVICYIIIEYIYKYESDISVGIYMLRRYCCFGTCRLARERRRWLRPGQACTGSGPARPLLSVRAFGRLPVQCRALPLS